jgi:thioredoxin 1
MVNNGVPEISEGEFNDFISGDGNCVLVDFYAEWCMPCVMMAPVIEELSEKMKGKIKFCKVNVDDNHKIAQKFKVASIPNFVLFKDGQVVDQIIGGVGVDVLEKKLGKWC